MRVVVGLALVQVHSKGRRTGQTMEQSGLILGGTPVVTEDVRFTRGPEWN